MTHDAQLRTVDIGYGGPEFVAAEQKLAGTTASSM